MEFNHDSRKKNIIRTSLVNCICKGLQIIAGLGYRVFFLRILTVEYLGLNGLFSNILGVLSLADIGIADAVIYRLYHPINTEDVKTVGQLMRFYKKSYYIIALVISTLGCIVSLFLKYLIKDAAEIPTDVNLYTIYFLFLLQTVSSYLFSYKFALLNADQKAYQNTIISTICILFKYVLQLVILVATKNYTLSIGIGIAANIIINFIASIWVSHQYPAVFSERTSPAETEKKGIYKDTIAALLHKIGGTALSSTDNILLSKYIGLSVTGIYSNYVVVLSGISGITGMVLSALVPSLGNAHVSLEPEERYILYKKSLFMNFWLISLVSVCIYNLIDDFIVLWLGKKLLLDPLTVSLLCIQLYIEGVRSVSCSYTLACGLFVKDRARPIIEALLNLGISILFLKLVGTPGIFIGTIASCLLTVFWREPYLLHKYAFGKSMKDYWLMYIKYTLLSVIAAICSVKIKNLLFSSGVSIVSWFVTGIITVALFETLHITIFRKDPNFQYYLRLFSGRIALRKR